MTSHTNDSVERSRTLLSHALSSTAQGDELAPELRDGVWFYHATNIPIPGAVDRTLADIAEVRMITRGKGDPIAVLISAAEIAANPALGWASEVGTQVRQIPEPEYEVPYAIWQEHSAHPVGVVAPEWHGTGIPRLLAQHERALRFARHEADRLAEERARTIAIAVHLGESRKDIGKTLNITSVRVAQIVDELPDAEKLAVKDLMADVIAVIRYVGSRTLGVDEVVRDVSCDTELVSDLIEIGLLEREGSKLRVTAAGEAAELHLRSKKQKASG
jgi:GNAT superfamily N-acetyltransferase